MNVKVSKRYADVAQLRRTSPGRDIELDSFDLDDTEPAPGKTPAKNTADTKSDSKADAKTEPREPVFIWRGIKFRELAVDEGKKKGGRLEIVRIKKGSPADRAGLYEGMIITELKHAGDSSIQKLGSLADLKRLAATVTGSAALYSTLDGYVSVDEK
jgi:hypothetical protein